MQYWMLQLFLTSRERPPIIDKLAAPAISRQEYLRQVFSGEIAFEAHKRHYIYRNYSEIDGVMAAAIGRRKTVTIKPRDDFQAQEMPDWETSNVLINLGAATDGQRVAMQHTPHIAPLQVFRALTDLINRKNIDSDWIIAVNAVSSAGEFWKAVEENKGHLTELELVYIPPNIWGAKDETQKALKHLHAETNTDKVEVRVRNADGKLDLEGETVRQSVEYISEGGGKTALKVGRRKVFDSESAIVTQSPEEDVEVEGAEPGLLRNLIHRLFRI